MCCLIKLYIEIVFFNVVVTYYKKKRFLGWKRLSFIKDQKANSHSDIILSKPSLWNQATHLKD